MRDTFGGEHSIQCDAALVAYERALTALAANRPLAMQALEEATALERDFTAAHALKGFASLLLARGELVAQARAAHMAAVVAAQGEHAVLPDEAALTVALESAIEGHLLRAADILDDRLRENPTNFLILKLVHALRFMSGDTRGMLASTARALPAWSNELPTAGYFFGCHAFALEEAGDYRQAEKFAETALQLAPDDAWGLHALVHVYQAQGRNHEAGERIGLTRGMWKGCNNFQFHIAWHLALCQIEAGELARALDLYDHEIRPQPTDDFRDIANATSLLWRLEDEGVDVGSRWEELCTIADRRAADTTLMFASLHNLIALVARNDTQAIARMIAAWQRTTARCSNDQAHVASRIGLDFARILAGGTLLKSGIADILGRLSLLGGSNAQRDIFVRTLVRTTQRQGCVETVCGMLESRRTAQVQDRFASRTLQQLEYTASR